MKQRKDFEPAYLVSPTLYGRRATLHVFDHLEPGVVQVDSQGRKVNVVYHVYRCTETGAMRRWGFEAGTVQVGN